MHFNLNSHYLPNLLWSVQQLEHPTVFPQLLLEPCTAPLRHVCPPATAVTSLWWALQPWNLLSGWGQHSGKWPGATESIMFSWSCKQSFISSLQGSFWPVTSLTNQSCSFQLTLNTLPVRLAAELASPCSAPSSPQPLPGPSTSTGQLSATHTPYGQALQEEPGADQLQGAGSGSGGGHSSKPRGAESRGCVEAKATANARPAARAGEKQRRACLPGRSGFWNVVKPSVTPLLCVVPKYVYLTCSAGDIWTSTCEDLHETFYTAGACLFSLLAECNSLLFWHLFVGFPPTQLCEGHLSEAVWLLPR